MKEEAEDTYETIFKPLIYTNGCLDEEKVKNEMIDLIFIYLQVSKVYMALTGQELSNPNYYADVIISLHEDEIQKAYNEGYDDAREVSI